MSLFMPCREAVARLTDLQEDALPWTTKLMVRMHLARCGNCRKIQGTLKALPGFIKQHLEKKDDQLEAKAALDWVMAHLEQEPRRFEVNPVPEALRPLLTEGDVYLSIQERVRKAMTQGSPRNEAPRVPEAVLAELPPMERWQWQRIPFSRVKIATLMEDAGRALMLMLAPPGYRYPAHAHLGTESVLVLDGELDDDGHQMATGDWVYYGPGSVHAPRAGDEGCWTLVRIEGGFRHEGLLGQIRNLFG